MGEVHQIHDAQLGRTVAAKSLHRLDSEEILRLKREFRVLEEMRHPNLVRLYELFVGDEHCFFTMELVSGVNFYEHVRGRPGSTGGRGLPVHLDAEALRDALVQLASGLAFLHEGGLLHRDIKPTNVLVERSGRVVLLDFGLASALFSPLSERSRAHGPVGTFAYMAPEVARGDPSSIAADWYGVGVMLYEALTGELPARHQNLRALIDAAVPGADEFPVNAEAPADLAELSRDLLRRDPAERPGAIDVLARLRGLGSGPSAKPAPTAVAVASDPFVGRREELARLQESFEASRASLTLLQVEGDSGIGKTALAHHFLSQNLPEEAIVLRSRCHPRETVPFKAVDGLVDDLARHLAHADDPDVGALLPRNSGELLRTFPVMGRVPALSAASNAASSAAEPHERRRRAFRALRELLGRLAERRPLVLWIDDAHWGDADSATLLRAILRPPDPPRLLLLLCRRDRTQDEEDGHDLLTRGLERLSAPLRSLKIGPMSDSDIRKLVASFEPARAPVEALQRTVEVASGSPFLAIELARAAPSPGAPPSSNSFPLGGLLLSRVMDLPDPAREVLEVLTVAGHPVAESVLASALGRPVDDLWDLAAGRLVRLVPERSQRAVQIYHDAVGRAIGEALDPGRAKEIHLRLAETFDRFPGRYDESRVDHLLAAGEVARAADSAFDAAESAAAAATFLRAASFYSRAIDLGAKCCPQWLLLAKLAEVLVNAGRSPEAGPRFLEASMSLEAEAPEDIRVLALRRRAACEFLRGGLYEEGQQVLQDTYRRLGMAFPTTRLRSLAWIGVGRMRLRLREWLGRNTETAHGAAEGLDRERLELSWAAGQGSTFINLLRAAAFQIQHAEIAARLGDPKHVALASATEALLVAWEQGDPGAAKAEALLLDAELLGSKVADPLVSAHSLVMRAVSALVLGRIREGLELSERGERLCRTECLGANWELVTFHQNILLAHTLLGDLSAASNAMHRVLRQADERGDYFANAILPVGQQNLVWLAEDRPEEAEQKVRRAVGLSFQEDGVWYAYLGEIARAQIDLYRGDGQAGLERIQRLWPLLRSGYLIRMRTIRANVRDLRARCAVAAAEADGVDSSTRASLLRVALDDAHHNRAEPVAWLRPFADRTEGAVRALQGDIAGGADLLERGARGFEHLGMGLYAAGAKRRAALLAGGSESVRRVAVAEQWMRDHGVREPERMSLVL